MQCSFEYLCQSGCDQFLLNVTGHDYSSFSKLLAKFKHVYDRYKFGHEEIIWKKEYRSDGRPRGKKRNLIARGAFVLVLIWYRTRISCTRSLAISFGQTYTPLYMWLKFARRVMLHILSRDQDSIIRLPTAEEVYFYKGATGSRYPHAPDAWPLSMV